MIPLLPCFKVLPLVFDESLSYYETLCKLINCLQEVAKNCDSNFQNQQKEIEEILKQLQELKDYIDQKTSGITDGFDEKIQNAYNDSLAYTDEKYKELLNILKINNDDIRKWVKGMIDNIPNAFAKQFVITGDPKTSGIRQDYQTCIRESQHDFVDSNRWTAQTFENIGMTCVMLTQIFYNVYEFDTKRLNARPRSWFSSSSDKRNANSFWFKSSDLIFAGSTSQNYTLDILFTGVKSVIDSEETRVALDIYHDNEKIYFKFSRIALTTFTVLEVIKTLVFPYQEVWIGINLSSELYTDKIVVTQPSYDDNQQLYNDSFMNRDVKSALNSALYKAKVSNFTVKRGSSQISDNLYKYYLQYLTK